MSDMRRVPPSAGWYSLATNDLAYFDGVLWTWRGRRGPDGAWEQEPIVPPSRTTPPVRPQSDRPTGKPAGSHDPGGLGDTSTARSPFDPLAHRPPHYPTVHDEGFSSQGPGAGMFPLLGDASGRVDLCLREPQRQARWKTLFRPVLAIPHIIVLWLLGIAQFVVTILMWFAALVMARVPSGMWRFSQGVLHWQARVSAYMLLLTDRYPPFGLGAYTFPVSITLEGPPARLNRWAVLFRVILVLPALLIVSVYSSGILFVAVCAWVSSLVAGRCPRALHLTLAAWLRYRLRYDAYILLLTTEYPKRPLGDDGDNRGSLEAGRIVLSGAAKGFAVATMVIGALVFVGDIVGSIGQAHTTVVTQQAIVQWNSLNSRGAAMQTRYRSAFEACGGQLACVQRADAILVQGLETQISSIEA